MNQSMHGEHPLLTHLAGSSLPLYPIIPNVILYRRPATWVEAGSGAVSSGGGGSMSSRQTPNSEVSLGLLEQPGHLCVSICVYNWNPRGFCACLSVCIAGSPEVISSFISSSYVQLNPWKPSGPLEGRGRPQARRSWNREITATWETMPWAYCGSADLAMLNWKGLYRGQLLL